MDIVEFDFFITFLMGVCCSMHYVLGVWSIENVAELEMM